MIRALTVGDAASVQALVQASPPLDVHTPYTYWVLLATEGSRCVGEFANDGSLIGCVLALGFGDALFFWQVGVAGGQRGRGMAGNLVAEAWRLARDAGAVRAEVTIADDNTASRAVFERFAREHALMFVRAGEAFVVDAAGEVVEVEARWRMAPLGVEDERP